jgi:uncharacterized membrane protein YkvA (DUF1232 family)
MTLRITFELGDEDLKHFKLIMREARNAAANFSEEDIKTTAHKLLKEVRDANPPAFIRERLEQITVMIGMIDDQEWELPDQERSRVMNALAYFSEPEDLIPDHIPGLGFLDDAIMIELVIRELKHEIEAYTDFCGYRERELDSLRASDHVSREEWLKSRRQELHSRMRRRRRGERRSSRGHRRGRSPVSLF